MGIYTGKDVLITGGCGFVGSNLAEGLVIEGARVYILDDMSTGTLEHLSEIEGQYTLLQGSVCNRVLVQEIVSKVDIIFHLAARNIIASTKNPLDDFETNIGGTLNILLAARDSEVERVIYASSASVYGNARRLPINEDDTINLLSPYAVSKYAGEGYCMAFNENYGLPVAVLRLSNVYGRHQSPDNPYCGVVAKFIERAKQIKDIEVHGDGLQTRDFTYVSDVVNALLLAGINPRAEGEVFNVATGIETSINELAARVIEVAGPVYDYTLCYNHEIDEYVDIKHIDRRDIDNVRRRVLNIEKIRRKLGWIPQVDLSSGLEKTTLEGKANAQTDIGRDGRLARRPQSRPAKPRDRAGER